MPVTLKCNTCKEEYTVIPCKAKTSKFCSRKCQREFYGHSNEPNTVCTTCNKNFHLKPSAKTRYSRTNGYFCSKSCFTAYKKVNQRRENNPNWKGLGVNTDGYPYYKNKGLDEVEEILEHRALCCKKLGITKLHRLLAVHHRDGNILNNDLSNLAILSASDHKWLHHQLDLNSLKAISQGTDIESLIQYCKDKPRLIKLLKTCVINQSLEEIAVFKGGELLESPEVGNQQPSLGSDTFEGSTTNSRVLRDSNADKSALHSMSDDIV